MCEACQDAEAQYGAGSQPAHAVQRFLHPPTPIQRQAHGRALADLHDYLDARHDDDRA